MFDVITVGSATRDIFLDASFLKKKQDYLCLDCGYKFDIEKPFIQTGGGATNTAVSFSRLGIKTAILTKVGNDGPGYSVKKTLQDENVNTGFIQTDDKLGTAMSIVIWKEKDRTIFTYRGASENIKLKHFNKPADGWYVWVVDDKGNFVVGDRTTSESVKYGHKLSCFVDDDEVIKQIGTFTGVDNGKPYTYIFDQEGRTVSQTADKLCPAVEH